MTTSGLHFRIKQKSTQLMTQTGLKYRLYVKLDSLR
jgi:hypothetical protein